MTAVPAGSIIGIDTIVFIYHLEDHPLFGPITERLLAEIESGKYHAVTSYVTLLEILVKPKKDGLPRAVADYRDLLLTFPNLKFSPLDLRVADMASTLRARYQIKTPDAIQIATAIAEGAKVFITNDEQVKKVSEIRVLSLHEWQ